MAQEADGDFDEEGKRHIKNHKEGNGKPTCFIFP